jgi:hypothetical protein
MTTENEIEKLAIIGHDAYISLGGNWIYVATAIMAAVEKKYAGEPGPKPTEETPRIPYGFIVLPKSGGGSLYIRATEVDLISSGEDKNICWVYRGPHDAHKCLCSAEKAASMVATILGGKRKASE